MFCESFTDKVIEHFMCPRNAGSMPDADAEGTCGDPSCGDSLTLYIKVKDKLPAIISRLRGFSPVWNAIKAEAK